MRKPLAIVLCILCALSLLLATAQASSTDYPTMPVTALVSWAPGGASDLLTRTIANHFNEFAGQPMIVNNIDGGASVVGVTEYMGYESNAYNVLFWATAQTIKTQMQVTPYAATDFQAVASFTFDSPYILVNKDSPFQTLQDLVEYAKANPGKLTMGNSGAGGGNHLAALQFGIAAGIEINHIPYGGGGASAQGAMAGEVDCSMNVPPEGIAQIESGDLRVLAVLSAERSPFFPDVPTAKESGYDAVNEQARGFVVHKDTDPAIVAKLEEIFRNISEKEEFQKAVADMTMNAKFMNAEEYGAAIAAEDELYKGIIQENGLGDRY